MGKRVKDEEEFDFSDIVDENEFDFSDIKDDDESVDEFDFTDIKEEEPSMWGSISASLKGLSPVGKSIYDFGRTIYSGFVDTVPQTVAQANEVRKSAMAPANLKDYIKQYKSRDFQRYVRERDPEYQGLSGAFTSFKGVDEYVDKYGREFIEAQGLGKTIDDIEDNLPETIQRRKDLEAYVSLQKEEAGDKLQGVVQDFRDIKDVSDFGSYISGLGGQAAYQIPVSVGTAGLSSYVMESATVYDKQLDRLAQEYGISREEVIERNLDSPVAGQTYAVLAGALDATSAGQVIGAFRRSGGSLLKKFLTQQVEGVTEASQGVLEDLGAGGKLAENLTEEGIAARANEYFGGVVGGTFSFFGKGDQKKLADKAINELGDTGDPELNGVMDAEATLTPQEEEVLKTKKAEENLSIIKEKEEKLAQEKQKLEEQIKKIDESEGEAKDEKKAEIQERLNEIDSQFANRDNAENTETNTAEQAEVKSFEQTPEYVEADKKVREIADQVRENPTAELGKALNEAIQERDNARIAFENQKPRTKKKTEIQQKIEDTTGVTQPGKTIKLTASEAIKAQFDSVTKGMKKGVKIGVEETNKLIDKVRTTLKEYNLSDKQRDAILTKVRNTDINAFGTSKRSVSALNQFIDNVVKDAEYADKIKEAKNINRQLRKLSKNKSNLQSYRTLARTFASIDPEDSFINKHLKEGGKILSALSSPKTAKYSSTEIAAIEEYVNKLKSQIEETQTVAQEEETEASNDGKEERLRVLRATADNSIESLKSKDLSDFDDSERSTIESIKRIDTSKLDSDQLATVVRVVDNIVDNDSLINTARVDSISNAQTIIQGIKDLLKGKKAFGLSGYGRASYNNARVFDAIFLDNDVAWKIRQMLGIQDLYAAGSRVEKYMHQQVKDLRKLVDKFNGGLRNLDPTKNILHIGNRVKMTGYALFLRRPVGSGNEHIPQIKKNIEQTIAVYEEAGEVEKVKAWTEVYEKLKNINTVEEAMAQFKSTEPGLFKVWKHISDTFKRDVNDRLKETTENVHNASYVEEENYTTSRIVQVISRESARQKFVDGVADFLTTRKSGKVKAKQSKTSLASTRKMSDGQAYSDDFIGDQLRAMRESLYDVEASKIKMKLGEVLYSKDFEDAVGNKNAKFILNQIEQSDLIQQEMGGVPDPEYLNFVNGIAQYAKNIGAAKALGSTIGQIVKQVPTVAIKAFNTHLAYGSTGILARSLSLRITPNIEKLLNNSQIGTAGLRLGGIERGNSISFNLSPGATQRLARVLQKGYNFTDNATRLALSTLTGADAAAKKRIALSYYLKKLKDLGVTKVNLEEEHNLQNDPKRQDAVAFMEHMMSITQTPSNPAELSDISKNSGNRAVNLLKTIFLPFSQYALEAKARLVVDIRKVAYNPTKENIAAVSGDIQEILLFSAIQLYIMNTYKDWIKSILEEILGVEPPEKDDDDEERLQRQREISAIGQALNTANPLSIGTFGEAGQTFILNRIAHAHYKAKNDSHIGFKQWKRETGGFLYEEDVDFGLLTLGFAPAVEATTSFIDFTDAESDGEIIIEDDWGRSKVLEPSENLKQVMAARGFIECLSSVGINEVDVFNQLRKIHKEQLKLELKDAPSLDE